MRTWPRPIPQKTLSSKSRRIGTSGEVRVAKYLATQGWPYAEHRALTGRLDKGDITGTPGLCWQIKAGHYAWNASDNDFIKWLDDANWQAGNANADYGILVVARERKQPRDWRAFIRLGDLYALAKGVVGIEIDWPLAPPAIPVQMRLEDMCDWLARAGYGDGRPNNARDSEATL